jgi:hypothetical protein
MTKLNDLKKRENLRGTQQPNLSGKSYIKSLFIRSFTGPNIMTGRVYLT